MQGPEACFPHISLPTRYVLALLWADVLFVELVVPPWCWPLCLCGQAESAEPPRSVSL